MLKRIQNLVQFLHNFNGSKRPKNGFDPAIDALKLSPKTHDEVASEYGFSSKTLNRWFKAKKLNIPRRRIDPYHQKVIYQTFGLPPKLKQD
jgi:hypothetical protein